MHVCSSEKSFSIPDTYTLFCRTNNDPYSGSSFPCTRLFASNLCDLIFHTECLWCVSKMCVKRVQQQELLRSLLETDPEPLPAVNKSTIFSTDQSCQIFPEKLKTATRPWSKSRNGQLRQKVTKEAVMKKDLNFCPTYFKLEKTWNQKKKICTFALYISNRREPWDHAKIFAPLLHIFQTVEDQLRFKKNPVEDHGTMRKYLHFCLTYFKLEKNIWP
jgi:hypothetical protein